MRRTGGEALLGELGALRRVELERVALRVKEAIVTGVEGELAGEGLQVKKEDEFAVKIGGERRRKRTIAVTMSGEARKFMVRRLPSLRALKLRLKEVRMAVRN